MSGSLPVDNAALASRDASAFVNNSGSRSHRCSNHRAPTIKDASPKPDERLTSCSKLAR
jgi:hypothetical protein